MSIVTDSPAAVVGYDAFVTVRWSDMDAFQHINHARMVTLLASTPHCCIRLVGIQVRTNFLWMRPDCIQTGWRSSVISHSTSPRAAS